MARIKSKYKKKYSRKVLEEYLATCNDIKEEEVVQQNEKTGYSMYKSKLKVVLPTVEAYAEFIGFHRDTLYTWAKAQPEFALALGRIKSLQKQKLIENGLQGTYNSTIAKLMLSSNHGMKERNDLTTDDKPLDTFTDEQINRIAERISRRGISAINPPVEK